MTPYKLISADSHIVEPPDLYAKRIEPRFRDRAPRLERLETPTGRKFDAWVIDGHQAGTLGAVIHAGNKEVDQRKEEGVKAGTFNLQRDPQGFISVDGSKESSEESKPSGESDNPTDDN